MVNSKKTREQRQQELLKLLGSETIYQLWRTAKKSPLGNPPVGSSGIQIVEDILNHEYPKG
jgi:hypothetical protein